MTSTIPEGWTRDVGKRVVSKGARHTWPKPRPCLGACKECRRVGCSVCGVVACKACGIERATSRGKPDFAKSLPPEIVTTYRWPAEGRWRTERPACSGNKDQTKLFPAVSESDAKESTQEADPWGLSGKVENVKVTVVKEMPNLPVRERVPYKYVEKPEPMTEVVVMLGVDGRPLHKSVQVTFEIATDGRWFGAEDEWLVFVHASDKTKPPLPHVSTVIWKGSCGMPKAERIATELRKVTPNRVDVYVVCKRVHDGYLRSWQGTDRRDTREDGERWVFLTSGGKAAECENVEVPAGTDVPTVCGKPAKWVLEGDAICDECGQQRVMKGADPAKIRPVGERG